MGEPERRGAVSKRRNFIFGLPVFNTMEGSRNARCLCCGYKTLARPEAFELCQVCWWEDDGQDDADADVVRGTANGDLSLSQARTNFKLYGAAHPRFVANVRRPRKNEL